MTLNKETLKHSRILLEKPVPKIVTYMILGLCIIFFIIIYSMIKLEKKVGFDVEGYVTFKNNEYVASSVSGIVKEIHKDEGSIVSVGEKLVTLSSETEQIELREYNRQLGLIIDKENAINSYIESLDTRNNNLSKNDLELEYYGKIMYFLDVVEKDESLLNVMTEKIKVKEKQIIKLQDEGNSIDIQGVNEEIEQLNQELTMGLQAETTYLQLISEAGQIKTEIMSQKNQIQNQIKVVEDKISLAAIKANKDGTLHYLFPIKKGQSMQMHQIVGVVSDLKHENVVIEAFVPANKRKSIELSNTIFVSFPIKKSSKMKATVQSIDSGSVVNESSNQVFFRVHLDIDCSLSDLLINDLPVHIEFIESSQSYLSWFLESSGIRF